MKPRWGLGSFVMPAWDIAARTAVALLLISTLQLVVTSRTNENMQARPALERDQFGIPVDYFRQTVHTFRRGESLSGVLASHDIESAAAYNAATKVQSLIDLKRIRAGDPIHVYTDALTGANSIFVYRPSPERYVTFDFRDSVAIYEGTLKTRVVEHSATVNVETNLYKALIDLKLSPALASQLANIFAWQVSFYHLQKGDQFSLLFEDRLIDSTSIGTTIIAARLEHGGRSHYAYRFDHQGLTDYYDGEGRSLRRPFLRAPINYTRISSRYSKRRFHPVQRRYKAHLGTDFAAPVGTPIVATADGVVTHATYSSGNGRYVKIRHHDVYMTAYLHMSKIAQGIRPGRAVQQGEIIGYVGSTGLATGPHVCYRFWVNGQQVDALQVSLPPSKPLPADAMPAFSMVRDSLDHRLPTTP